METAMGKKFYAQNNSTSEYVKAIYIICLIFMEKQARPWMQVSLIANLLGRAKMEEECLKILHGLSNETIKDRRKKREELRLSGKEKNSDENLGKKRMSFLDLLLEYSEDHEILSDEDIREEVDTFMFEGHDTTAASVNWTLYLLGQHPEIQINMFRFEVFRSSNFRTKHTKEIESIFGSSDRDATSSDIREMKYLECCIKESLRLFPSVPAFGRELNEDVIIDGYTVPKGTSTVIFAYQLHRDPEVFPEPNTFKPERFFPENYANRSPYAYIPFSAGPRNCIGQKFALMEEKVILSTFLRKYRVESILKMEELNVAPEVILRNETENLMKIFPRH
ncbi:Cytochrome P450 97B2, chloroplastic [Armadillidium nasatum]|uniref:Cytochrome P450 97B2, chloroplastic n=1 Tax=Armadillidium nasatum TaxID=96803 RepID=A0A5N5TH33_9CRUS|nr:Cytochrome P450 97B2, chloroplastic [Armadillidium nasatum]